MDGLERILQLRRGFSGLSDHAHMFSFWYDWMFSVDIA
jgi:hypothetical protein